MPRIDTKTGQHTAVHALLLQKAMPDVLGVGEVLATVLLKIPSTYCMLHT